MQIKGKAVLVTGANRGIGASIVRELLQQDVGKVYAAARKPESLPDFADRRVIPLTLDITDQAQVARATQTASDTQILINNAGSAVSRGILASPYDAIAQDMNVNYFGTLNVTRAFVPVLEKNEGSAIVNLLSILSLASRPALGGYSATKAALYSLTQSLRADLVGKKIHVMGVFPSFTDTDLTREFKGVPKASPDLIAQNLAEGLLTDQEDVFPDPRSRQMYQLWKSNSKDLEKDLAGFQPSHANVTR